MLCNGLPQRCENKALFVVFMTVGRVGGEERAAVDWLRSEDGLGFFS